MCYNLPNKYTSFVTALTVAHVAPPSSTFQPLRIGCLPSQRTNAAASVLREASSPTAVSLGAPGLPFNFRPSTSSNSPRIRTYRQTPCFAAFWPKLAAFIPFEINTYRLCFCNPFRIRTYRKTGEVGHIMLTSGSRAPEQGGFQGLYLQTLNEKRQPNAAIRPRRPSRPSSRRRNSTATSRARTSHVQLRTASCRACRRAGVSADSASSTSAMNSSTDW